MRRRLLSPLVLISTAALVMGLAAVRAYFGVVPHGVRYTPWMEARVDGPVLVSPDGRRVVRAYFNDAGAMHSGNHWTWIVEDSWWYGRFVVAQGFLGPEVAVSGQPVPLEWVGDNEIRVRFLPKRYSER